MSESIRKWIFTPSKRSAIPFVVLFIIILLVSAHFRKVKEANIREHSKYTFGEIFKKTGSLKNSNDWHYKFFYKGEEFEDYKSTHVDYDVNIGDYFIINFSSVNPIHNKILYEYKLKDTIGNFIHESWDTLPKTLVRSGRKPF